MQDKPLNALQRTTDQYLAMLSLTFCGITLQHIVSQGMSILRVDSDVHSRLTATRHHFKLCVAIILTHTSMILQQTKLFKLYSVVTNC